jgi:cysteine desulfurase
MIPYFTEHYGNPNSQHISGRAALDALSIARDKVCKLINADFEEVIFTSGTTESSRITIERASVSLMKTGCRKFVTTKSEHKSVLDCADYIKSHSIEVIYLNIKNDGLIDFEQLDGILDESVGLVSVCMVNNETGVLQDIKNIAELCHGKGALIHVDATQAFGKIPIDVGELDIDFMSASGHKVYGPKGIGILFYKKKNKKFLRVPGANQEVEFGVRSGTVPVPLCIGMGKASEIALHEMKDDFANISKLHRILIDALKGSLDEVYINGSAESNYPGILNVSLRGCEGEALMMECKRIMVSSGSACTSNKLTISHVLDAMSIPSDIAQSSLRITIGKFTTEADIMIAIDDIITATTKLRKMSPVWDMITSGMDLDSIFEGKYCGHAV